MALAKHAEEIQEKIEERMAMRELAFTQERRPQHSAATTQSTYRETDAALRPTFAGERCFC